MNAVALLQQVLQRRFLLPALCCCCLAAVGAANHQSQTPDAKAPSTTRPDTVAAADPEPQASDSQTEPLPLNLSEFLYQPNSQAPVLKSFSGRQVIDGLPFQIDGQVRVYGKTPEAHADGVYPFSLKGIRIGRKFDTLYLIHHATWPERRRDDDRLHRSELCRRNRVHLSHPLRRPRPRLVQSAFLREGGGVRSRHENLLAPRPREVQGAGSHFREQVRKPVAG